MRIKLALFLIAVGLIAGWTVAITRSVKEKLEAALSETFQRQVSIKTLAFTVPPGIRLSGITISSGNGFLASVEQGVARFSLLGLLKGKPGIDLELVGPKLLLERNSGGHLSFPLFPGSPQAGKVEETRSTPSEGTAPEPIEQRSPRAAMPFSRLRIRDGELTFTDKDVSPEVVWTIKNLGVSVKGGLRTGEYGYNIIGSLVGEEKESLGDFQFTGDFLLDDAGTAQISINHKSFKHIEPYVRPVLGTAPDKGSFKIETKLTLHQGVIVAETKLSASHVVFPTDEPTVIGPAGNRLVKLLEDKDGVIHLDFVVTGKLGEKLDWSDLMKSTLRETMRQALARNIQRVLTDAEQTNSIEELIRKSLDSLGR